MQSHVTRGDRGHNVAFCYCVSISIGIKSSWDVDVRRTIDAVRNVIRSQPLIVVTSLCGDRRNLPEFTEVSLDVLIGVG